MDGLGLCVQILFLCQKFFYIEQKYTLSVLNSFYISTFFDCSIVEISMLYSFSMIRTLGS
jgi:hypothetical protein